MKTRSVREKFVSFLMVISLLLTSVAPTVSAQEGEVAGARDLPASAPAQEGERPPTDPIPGSELARQIREGRWPSQTVSSTGNVQSSRYGPQRHNPEDGIPRYAYSPFDERNNREYPCPPGGCDFEADTLLIKLAPEVELVSGRSAGAWTSDARLNQALSAQALLQVEPIFPTATRPLPGQRTVRPDGSEMETPDLTRWHRVRLVARSGQEGPGGADAVLAAVERMARLPGIEYAEPDFLRRPAGALNSERWPVIAGETAAEGEERAASSFNDPLYAQQWHLTAANITQAWDYLSSQGLPPGGSRDIVVAVIDTGVDYTHPDLAANMWINPAEFYGQPGVDDDGNGYVDDIHGVTTVSNQHSGDPQDDHGHGTHVAGIIAAQAGNGIGGVGVAYNVQIMAIKAAQYSGVLAASDIAQGIYYAVEKGADVINMSFGGYARSQLEEDALAVAFGQAVLVAAAGNDGRVNLPCPFGRDMYPAAYNWVLGVMARNPSPNAQGDYLAGFSNYDCRLQDSHEYELMAPGVGIWSTLPNASYAAWAGTSMATPVVAGIAALARTKWADKDVYSSRFIMGQIATTGGLMQAYTPPQGAPVSYYVPNALSALTTTPQPKLSYLEHWLFDTPNLNPVNDNDGIVDAGETIDLAIVIRNHWGKADNVSVKLEAWAEGAFQADPYVTFITDTVNYGTVGSFNIDDNGLIYENDAIVGVRHPFRFIVDPSTPNDHVIPFQLTITGRNGYAPDDPTLYTAESRFFLLVQRGRELPRIIDQDMTLTKDNLWLVSDASLIEAGVTVTVTEGTQIQFFSVDPNNPYAQNAKPKIQVEGTLEVRGTPEQPVEMFTGILYPAHPIVISQAGNGSTYLRYARIMNPVIGDSSDLYSSTGDQKPITFIEHSYFTQGVFDCIYRYAYWSTPTQWGDCYQAPVLRADQIQTSILRSLGGQWTPLEHLEALSTSLLDSNTMRLQGFNPASENVFLKNYKLYDTQWGDREYWVSQVSDVGYGIYKPTFLRTAFPVQYNGKTYVALARPWNIDPSNYLDIAEEFANQLGGHVVTINDAAENQFLVNYRNNNFNQTVFQQNYPTMNCGQNGHWNGCWGLFAGDFMIGLTDRDVKGQFHWLSGEPLTYTNWHSGSPYNIGCSNCNVYMSSDGRWYDTPEFSGPVILELPGVLGQALLNRTAVEFENNHPIIPRAQVHSAQLDVVSRSADVTPFLDLPFAYTNFAEAALGNVNGQSAGRVLAWFDHSSPNNAADGSLVLWTGVYNTSIASNITRDGCTTGLGCYDGHNGVDFAPVTPNEAVFAAASGTVIAVASDSRYGNQIWIDHGNGYATLYGHLASTNVTTGTVITDRLTQPLGIMGATGDARGIHLHFGVYYDQNNDGVWSEDEAVDPYGWLGQGSDPWAMPHPYLWLHPLKSEAIVDPSLGVDTVIVGPSGQITLTIPSGAFTSTVTLELWETPSVTGPERDNWWGNHTRSIGRSFWLRKIAGDAILQGGYQIEISYRPTDTLHLQEGSLRLFRHNDSNTMWEDSVGGVDPNQNRFQSWLYNLGHFDLQTGLSCGNDSNEINDSPLSARAIGTDNAPRYAVFDIPDDQDWFRFEAVEGERYLISTSDLNNDVNTYLELFDRDGAILLAADDNSGGGYASRIEWQAPTDGVYFIRVTPVTGSRTDCNASYRVRVNWRAEQAEAQLEAARQEMIAVGPSIGFKNNAILNVWWDPNINHWMRFFMNDPRDWVRYLNGNWWGTTNTTLIDAAIQDYNDDFNKGLYVYQPILTTPPETAYPFVTDVILSTSALANATVVGAEPVTFTVKFNRDMDPLVQPAVSFGPDVPQTDYTVHGVGGGWIDLRTWQGVFNISPVTGDGYQFMRVAGARAADDPWLVTGDDTERFRFEIITSGTESMNLQANGGEGYVDLMWTQTDFDLLAGFNLYRADSADGEYARINSNIIPAQQRSYRDTDVTPGQPYFYKFTVVQTSMAESDFSNIATGTPIDTIAPTISHTPVTAAPSGLPLTLVADVTDNVAVTSVTLFHRRGGTSDYNSRAMTKTTGDRYTATLEGSLLVSPGVEYYIQASDGVNVVRNGRPELPHTILVDDRPTVTSITPNRGTAAGGTVVTIRGSNFKAGATVSFGGALAEAVQVQSSSQISATTPANIPVKVDVSVTNSDGQSGSLLQGYTYEADAISLGVADGNGGQGGSGEIAISAANVQGLVAADLTLTFDSAILQGVSARTGNLTPGWTLVTNTSTPGQVRLSLVSTGGAVSGSGVLAHVLFDVIGAPGSSAALQLNNLSFNDGAIPTQMTPGTFTVDDVYDVSGQINFWNGGVISNTQLTLQGDRLFSGVSLSNGVYTVRGAPTGNYTLTPSKADEANGISAYDASLALQHAAGINTLSGPAAIAADVNRSGSVNAMDAYYILQQAAELSTLPFPGAGAVWAFEPSTRSITGLNAHRTGEDFSGILLGDPSGNWAGGGAVAAAAEGAPTPLVLRVAALTGNVVTATLWVEAGANPVHAVDLALQATGATVDAMTITLDPQAAGWIEAANVGADGRVRIAIAGPQPFAGGALALFRFTVQEPADGLTLTPLTAALDEVPVEVQIEQDTPGSIRDIYLPLMRR